MRKFKIFLLADYNNIGPSGLLLLEKIANEYAEQNISVVLLEARDDQRKSVSNFRSYAIGMTEASWKGCESSSGLKEHLQNTACSYITNTSFYEWKLTSSVSVRSKRYLTTQVI